MKDVRLRVLRADHLDTLRAVENLAATYRHQRRWREAEDLELYVQDSRLRVLGEGHPDTLSATENLAIMYNSQGRWTEALELQL